MSPPEPPPAPDVDVVRIPAADGAVVAVKRRRRPGGIPVVLLHGITVNADIWDLPEVSGAGFEYHSVASMLHERGCDVWLVNWRGHGAPHMLSKPPPGQDDWCVDHLVCYDLPAVIEHVADATGRRPFVLGGSLGAMVLAGYLQGATLRGSDGAERVVADADLARRRQQRVAGAVFVGFPAALRWPRSMYDADGRVRWDVVLRDLARPTGETNVVFEALARWAWLETLVQGLGGVRLEWLRPGPGRRVIESLPAPLAEAARKVERTLVQFGLNLAGMFTGNTQHRAEVIIRGRRYVLEGERAGVMAQLAKSVRVGGFVSALGSPDHDYVRCYPLISTPALVVAGGRDRIASAEVTREEFFDRIASPDKRFALFDELGHGEFEAAPAACARVYPEILDWVLARA